MQHPSDEPTTHRAPLVALLDAAAHRFAAAAAERLRGSAFADLSLAHSRNVLRFLQGGPVTSTDLVQRSGVSKQAVSQQVAQLARLGYVETVAHPTDGRARLVQLTERGRDAQATVHRIFADVERAWRMELGDDAWAGLVASLDRLTGVSAHPIVAPMPETYSADRRMRAHRHGS